MMSFTHSNVLSLIGVCMDWGPAPLIVMPFMANGSLLNYLRRERSDLYWEDANETEKVNSPCTKNYNTSPLAKVTLSSLCVYSDALG